MAVEATVIKYLLYNSFSKTVFFTKCTLGLRDNEQYGFLVKVKT